MGPAVDDAVISFLQSPRVCILVIEVKFTGSTIFSARDYVDQCRRGVAMYTHECESQLSSILYVVT